MDPSRSRAIFSHRASVSIRKRGSRIRLGLLLAGALLAGCGGGSDYAGHPGPARESAFINFNGTANGDIVLDANGDSFGVTRREGCLYSDQYQVLTNWCLTGDGTALDFGSYFIRLVSHPDSYGGCVTVMVEERSALMIDIFLDRFGRLDYVITDLQAVRC